jgi:hypothetical protein
MINTIFDVGDVVTTSQVYDEHYFESSILPTPGSVGMVMEAFIHVDAGVSKYGVAWFNWTPPQNFKNGLSWHSNSDMKLFR